MRSKFHQLISSRFEARINCIMVKGGISLHHLLNQPLAHVFWIASCFKETIATLRQLLQHWGNYCKIEAAIATLRQLFLYWGDYCHIEATIATLRQLLLHWGNSCHIEATIATLRQLLLHWGNNHPCGWCAKVCVQALFALASYFSELECLQFLSLFICICFPQFRLFPVKKSRIIIINQAFIWNHCKPRNDYISKTKVSGFTNLRHAMLRIIQKLTSILREDFDAVFNTVFLQQCICICIWSSLC